MTSKTLGNVGIGLILIGIVSFFYTASVQLRDMYIVCAGTIVLGLLLMFLFGKARAASYSILVFGVIVILVTIFSKFIALSDGPIDYSYMILPLISGAVLILLGYLGVKKFINN